MISALAQPNSRHRKRPSASQAGFTLIELIVVIAASAMMMALLLPAVQRVRESSNRAQSTNNLRQIAIAAHNYHQSQGRFPALLAELLERAGFPDTGELDGYKASSYAADASGWTLAMNPVAGVTGSETAFARGFRDGQVAIEWRPTPGAQEGRNRMFDEVRAAVSTEIAVRLMPRARALAGASADRTIAQAIASPDAPRRSVEILQDPNGNLTFASIRQAAGANFVLSDGSVRHLRSIIERALAPMRLGAYGERPDRFPGVRFADIDGKAPGSLPFLSVEFLRSLTRFLVTDARLEQTLLGHLDRLELAIANGDQRTAETEAQSFERAVRPGSTAIKIFICPMDADTLAAILQLGLRYQF
jgi:prepilin-type N-terminal cleavage/methylation domain-containing protein